MSNNYNNTSNEAIYTTRDTSTDFVVSTEADVIGLAVVCIWAYLIPQFYIEYAEYRMALIQSPTWGRFPDRLQTAIQVLNRSFYLSICGGMVLFLGSSVLINVLTWEMDRRASDIVTGTSRLFAGVIFMFLSIHVPQWMGCYFSIADTYKTRIAMYRTTREIWFCFTWTLWKYLVSMFFFNLYFSCRTRPFTVLYGVLVGVPLGALLILITHLGRVKFKRRKRWISGTMGLILALASLLSVFSGVWFIEDVWNEDYKNQQYTYNVVISVTVLVVSLWAVFLIAAHVFAILAFRKYQKNTTLRNRYRSTIFQTYIPGFEPPKLQSMEERNVLTAKKTVVDDGDEVSPAEDVQSENGGNTTEAPPEGAENEGQLKEATLNDEENGDDQLDADFVMPQLKSNTKSKDFFASASETPSFWYLCRVKMYETYGFCCCCGYCSCCCKDIKQDNTINDSSRTDPIDRLKQNSFCWRFGDGLKLFLWYCISAFCLFLTIVNCGATSQQTIVRNSLNNAFEFLYPINYQTGPMCGWSEPNENGEIRSFDSLDELLSANFTLIHCGYCGECSNWNDLRLQWTTRTFLAEVTKKCAQKSMLGSVEDVQACNEAEPIGFTPGCAECWTVDELCAKKNCFWIFLQSLVINAVSDYRVQLNDITSATCDEAICGPEFVPCSGATRRRMNIKSDIERPLYQQCIHQDANWSVIFNHP